MTDSSNQAAAGPAEIRYALVLTWGVRFSRALLLAGLAALLWEPRPGLAALEHWPKLWRLSAAELAEATGLAHGWAWLGLLPHGDGLILLALTFLAATPLAGYLALSPILRRNDRLAFWLAQVQAVCLLAAFLL